MSALITWPEILGRLILAMLLTGMLGLDREVRNKPAGLRTFMLVGLGAAAFVICAFNSSVQISEGAVDSVQMDPLRIVAAVISGIGFLGAGAIIQSRGNVSGMTTAASIWLAGAVGLSCGCGQVIMAILMTFFGVFCLLPVQIFERRMIHRDDE